jgi:hypothetical protein
MTLVLPLSNKPNGCSMLPNWRDVHQSALAGVSRLDFFVIKMVMAMMILGKRTWHCLGSPIREYYSCLDKMYTNQPGKSFSPRAFSVRQWQQDAPQSAQVGVFCFGMVLAMVVAMLEVRTSRCLGSQVREYHSCLAMAMVMLGALGDYMKRCEKVFLMKENPSPIFKGYEISHLYRFYGLNYSQSLAMAFW